MTNILSRSIKVFLCFSLAVTSMGFAQTQVVGSDSSAELEQDIREAQRRALQNEAQISQNYQFLDASLNATTLTDISGSQSSQVTVRDIKSGTILRFTPKVTGNENDMVVIESLTNRGERLKVSSIKFSDIRTQAEAKVKFEDTLALLTAGQASINKQSRDVATSMWSIEKGCGTTTMGRNVETTYFGPGYLFIMLGIMAAILVGPSIKNIKIPKSLVRPIVVVCIALMVGVPFFMMASEKTCEK